VELSREKKNMQAVEELYSPDIVSIETPRHARHAGAHAGHRQNSREESLVVRQSRYSWRHGKRPVAARRRFIVTWRWDITAKTGPFAAKRMQHEEAALYTVKGGKIVQEEFFYHMGESRRARARVAPPAVLAHGARPARQPVMPRSEATRDLGVQRR
jgi:hypothetical protein